MMTNPHNHLYCEQYAEVGAHLCVRHQAGGQTGTNAGSVWMVPLSNTERHRHMLNVTGNIGSREETCLHKVVMYSLLRCRAVIASAAI